MAPQGVGRKVKDMGRRTMVRKATGQKVGVRQ